MEYLYVLNYLLKLILLILFFNYYIIYIEQKKLKGMNSENRGMASACEGCPNRAFCMSNKIVVDPGIYFLYYFFFFFFFFFENPKFN